MTTSKLTPKKFKSWLASAMIICLSVLLFPGCQKDELTEPSASSSVPAVTNDKTLNPEYEPYEMIKIDHERVRGTAPDYAVIIYSDGTALFVGRSNVSLIGRKNFIVDKETLWELNNLFITSNFFEIEIEKINVADLQSISTTFNNGLKSKTLVDNNTGNPRTLVMLRSVTESKLPIASWINESETP